MVYPNNPCVIIVDVANVYVIRHFHRQENVMDIKDHIVLGVINEVQQL